MLTLALRILLAVFFVLAGINHFLSPTTYLQIIPPSLPWPGLLNEISGAAEIAGGIGVLLPQVRVAAAWGLILLLLAVFPANIYALNHGMVIGGKTVSHEVLLWRLPGQIVFIFWVYWCCLRRPVRQV